MVTLISALLLAASLPLGVAALVLLIEILAASTGQLPDVGSDIVRGPVVVLIPAHDEGSAILPTLGDIKSQLRPGDRVLVVADNCSDNTAEIAEGAGVDVIHRNDPERRGKSFALDFGFRSLTEQDPRTLIVIDADCRVDEGTIDRLARTCVSTSRPVQALYLMRALPEDQNQHLISEFAWRVKNGLRPSGMHRLGLPCQLMGSGMAFPRDLLERMNLASGHLAEDLELGLQLAEAGHAPIFCPTARVSSHFPSTGAASLSQRRRWEHGHLWVIAKKVTPCLFRAVRDADWRLFVLGLDAAVPPLVLLGVLILLALAAGLLLWVVGGESAVFVAAAGALGCFVFSLLVAWLKSGRDLLTVRRMLALVPYLATKVQIYRHAWKGNKNWVRTDRSGTE